MEMITKADLEKTFLDLGIRKGSTVLLQADIKKIPGLIGMETTLIDALCDTIGPQGCLIVPTFTLQALDPVYEQASPWPVETWPAIRQAHPGYSSRTMPADIWPEVASAILLHTKVKRTEHPVYSFAWWGSAFCKPNLEQLDYPISFRHILREMENPKAVNLLIGLPLQESLYPMMVARKTRQDVTLVQRAFVRRVKKTFEEAFLHSCLDEESRQFVWTQLESREARLGDLPVYTVSLAASGAKTPAISSKRR